MRKVMYQYWVPARKIKINVDPGWETEPGTHCFSEPQSGYFHGWGFEAHEDATSIAMDSIAIVEDCKTGHIHSVSPQKMRFVLPPEKVKKVIECAGCEGKGEIALETVCPICKGAKVNEMTFEWLDPSVIDRNAAVGIINIEKVGKRVLNALLPVLESINKKLSTL